MAFLNNKELQDMSRCKNLTCNNCEVQKNHTKRTNKSYQIGEWTKRTACIHFREVFTSTHSNLITIG